MKGQLALSLPLRGWVLELEVETGPPEGNRVEPLRAWLATGHLASFDASGPPVHGWIWQDASTLIRLAQSGRWVCWSARRKDGALAPVGAIGGGSGWADLPTTMAAALAEVARWPSLYPVGRIQRTVAP